MAAGINISDLAAEKIKQFLAAEKRHQAARVHTATERERTRQPKIFLS
jgi:hypothetical protein